MSFWKKGAAPQIGVKGVKYGLQKKDDDAPPRRSKLAMFGDDDEVDVNKQDINSSLKAQKGTKLSDTKYRRVHEAALAADPNVYDYDSFHDGYQEARAAAEIKKHEDEKSGPKYIFALLAAQKQRDREQNVTYERTLARDRAAEDAMHGDKDVYVTSAYKKKLQEDELWQAQQEAKDKEDAKNSAFKKGNMDGFLNVLSSALAEPTRAAPAAPDTTDAPQATPSADPSAAGTSDDAAAAAAPAPGKRTLQADIQRRADHQLQQRVADMDKYELARYRAEQRLQARDDVEGSAAADAASPAPGTSGGEDEPAAAGSEPVAAAEPVALAPPVKRRADAETVSAAKERALARKRAREGA